MSKKSLDPAATEALKRLKVQVVGELGIAQGGAEYHRNLERMKYEAADEMGLDQAIRDGYWGNLTSRQCGAVGGCLGGRIGGQMVRHLIQEAETHFR